MSEIIAPAFVLGGLFDDGDLVVVAGVQGGVELVPEAVFSFFEQHPGADEIDEGATQAVVGKDAQGEIHGEDEKKQGQGNLLPRIVGEDAVDEQQRIFQTDTLQEYQQQGGPESGPLPEMLRNPEESENDDRKQQQDRQGLDESGKPVFSDPGLEFLFFKCH